MKKTAALILCVLLVLSFAGCNGGSTSSSATASTAGSSTASSAASESSASVAESSEEASTESTPAPDGVPTIDTLNLGEDYTDLTATLEFKTHRTDIVDTVFQQYIADFQKMYPGITINYEAVTDYSESITTRLSTPSWGDICMVPTTIPKTEYHNYFLPLGDTATLGQTYNFVENVAFGGKTYGVSSTNNVNGIVYNKAVFAAAGITEIPKTPEEFLSALQLIKDNTDAIPLYTNFAAGWTMGGWDGYISGSATGDPDFMNVKLAHMKDPFAPRGDGTGPFAVYNVLYEAVKRGLTEDDPTTTDWEGSKGMLNRGEIGTMALGSWSIVQMQEGGPNPDDIGYMSFPITVNGKQYAGAGPDYCYGINVNASLDNQIASMLYIKYLVEESNFDYDQGGVPTVKTHDLPNTLAAFDGIELVSDNPSPAGEEDLFTKVNVDSEVGLSMDNQHVIDIVEAALTGSKSMEDIVADWNARWTASQEKNGVTPE